MNTPTLGLFFRNTIIVIYTTCGFELAVHARRYLRHFDHIYFGHLGHCGSLAVLMEVVILFLSGAFACHLLIWWLFFGRLACLYPLPLCRRGMCQDYDGYRWLTLSIYGWEWWGKEWWWKYHYRCKCEEFEDEYVRKGKRFMIVGPNGELLPYKKLVGFRKWGEDKGGA